ncbi:S-adenosyl-L-methionine-dependent methyltransferase [Zopfochytrium polystomum]|nr:S-adenosyl-L-methionine-dependent methyltransferase [Zopfochytrium polystomum]
MAADADSTKFALPQGKRDYTMKDPSYFLPSDGEEQDRLRLQHRVTRTVLKGLFHAPLHDLFEAGGARVLDMGCGPGAWVEEMAKLYPKTEFDIVDIIADKSMPNFRFSAQNIVNGTDFPDNYFDFVHQPETVKELKRITKPGGFVEIVEIGPVLFDTGPKLTELTKAFAQESWDRGQDATVNLHVGDHAKAGGLTFIKEEKVPMGWDGQISRMAKSSYGGVFASCKPFLTKRLGLSDDEFDKYLAEAMEEYNDGYKPYFYISYAVGRVDK